MVHGKNRIPYWIDRRLTGLAGPDYDATISFGLPFEPEDSQYGKYRIQRSPMAGIQGFMSPRQRRWVPVSTGTTRVVQASPYAGSATNTGIVRDVRFW